MNKLLPNKITGAWGKSDYYLTITKDESNEWFVNNKTLGGEMWGFNWFSRDKDLETAMVQ